MWVMKWAELLKIRSDHNQGFSYKAALRYYEWLEDKIQRNVPFDQVVQELLGSQRRVVRAAGDQLLQRRARHAEDRREHRPGLHGHAGAVRPVPQSSVRSLDAG